MPRKSPRKRKKLLHDGTTDDEMKVLLKNCIKIIRFELTPRKWVPYEEDYIKTEFGDKYLDNKDLADYLKNLHTASIDISEKERIKGVNITPEEIKLKLRALNVSPEHISDTDIEGIPTFWIEFIKKRDKNNTIRDKYRYS